MPKNFWNIVKKIGIVIGIVAGLVTVIVGSITIFRSIFSPSANLIAEVETSRFELPPGVEKIISNAYSQEVQKVISGELKNLDPDLSKYPYLKNIWFVTIKNRGKLSCSSVKIKLPYVVVASVKKEGVQPFFVSTNEIVEIGELGPQEEAQIIAWANSLLFIYDQKMIRLTHKDGIGKVILKSTVGPFWSFLEKQWSFVIVTLLIVVNAVYQILKILNKK